MRRRVSALALASLVCGAVAWFWFDQNTSNAQPPGAGGREQGQPGGPPGAGRGGRGGRGGFGGFGRGGPPGFGRRGVKLVEKYDTNGDDRLDAKERAAARAGLKQEGRGGRGGRGGFGRGGFGRGGREPGKPGPKVSPKDVKSYPDAPLFSLDVVRTLFLEFENKDWEAELADFKGTDVEVPATLSVDGKEYPNVGVHFRGASSFGMVPAGLKRSLNVSLDFVDSKQRLYGYKTLNLLNCNGDDSMLSTILYSHIARKYLPAPKANFVHVVINGESWGVFVNAQQFNKNFTKEYYGSKKGERWKVPGSPRGDGGLAYNGENVEEYKRRYEIKSGDDAQAWKDLIHLSKILSETPADQLEEALAPILDVDEALWFLALDVVLVNSDGYWTRASDFNIYQDKKGKFHIIPHDMNEAFHARNGGGGRGGFGRGGPGGRGEPGGPRPSRPDELVPSPIQRFLELTEKQRTQIAELQKEADAGVAKILTKEQLTQLEQIRRRGPGGFGPGGPGGRGGRPGAGGVKLDPLVSIDDPRKPLRSKLLAVPAWREKYLSNVRTLAEKDLDWKNLGPVVAKQRALIEKLVEADTRKLSSYEAFLQATSPEPKGEGQGRFLPLKTFVDQRRAYLLEATSSKKP